MKKSTANKYLSQYILLRDALPPTYDIVKCCTCGRLMQRTARNSHAGHFIGKGMGGGSGVYYDERNVHAQCHNCNKYMQGNGAEYYPFMLAKYGQEVIDELRKKHLLTRPYSVDEYGIMYREKYKELKKQRHV